MMIEQEHIEHPFGKGNLTATGVQYSTAVDTTTANVDVAIETVIVQPPNLGNIVEFEFALTAAFCAVSTATADLIYQWQARNKDGTWVNLHVAVTKTNINTTYVEETYSGRFMPTANFNAVPFDVRLIIQCNEANEGRAKTKNSSYIKLVSRT